MAHTKEQWDKAKYLFELNKPLSYIVEKTGISKGQISKKANANGWEKETKGNDLKAEIKAFDEKKETLEAEKETLVNKLSSLDEYKITLLNEVIEDEVGKSTLLNSTASLSLIRKNQMLTADKKTTYVKVKEYSSEGMVQGESVEVIELPLSPADYKVIDEGIDKNAITLGLANRHAPKVEVNTQNNQVNTTNDIVGYKVKTIEQD